METFRRRLGLALTLVSSLLLFTACEEDTVPTITKFRISPECSNIVEHTAARVDENGQLVLDENGQPIFDPVGTYAEIQFFGRASGGNEESDPTGGNTPLSWEWNFGDGTVIQNVVTGFHKYYDAGDYTVTLTVKDKDGQMADAETHVVVGQIGGELDILSVDITNERSGRFQSTFNTSGLTRCEFKAWRYDVHGVLDTPCVVSGLTEQYEWRWQHRNQEVLHESDLVQDYNYPGPWSDLFVLTVTELSSQTSRVDSLTVVIPAEEKKMAALTGADITSEPVPKFGRDGANNCVFTGWDILLSGAATTRCGTLLSATQFTWDWTLSDLSTETGTAQVIRSYAYDPQNPGEFTDNATLRVTEALVNPQGETENVFQEKAIEYVIPESPVTTVRRIELRLVDLDDDPRRTVYTDPVWDLVDDGQGGTTCEFIGWDVYYDVQVISGCEVMDDPTAQYEWHFDYGDGTEAIDPVGPQRHRYLYDPSTPSGYLATTTLTVTDRNTVQQFANHDRNGSVQVSLPQLPSSIPSPCPDNAKH